MESTKSENKSRSKIEGPIDLLVNAWHTFRSHWKILTQILFLPFVYLIVVQLIMSLLFIDRHMPMSLGIIFSIIGIILYVGSIVLSITQIPTFILSLHEAHTEPHKKQTLEGQYKVGLKYFWWYVLLCIIAALVLLGSFAILIIPGIIMVVYMSTSTFSLVVDGKKSLDSFAESYSLVRGKWWPVFGRLLFLILVTVVAYFLFLGLFFVINLSVINLVGAIIAAIVSIVLGFLLLVLINSVSLIYLYGLFNSLKAARSHNASVKVFKGWIVGFLCVGVLALVFMLVAPVALVNYMPESNDRINSSFDRRVQSQSSRYAPRMDNQYR